MFNSLFQFISTLSITNTVQNVQAVIQLLSSTRIWYKIFLHAN